MKAMILAAGRGTRLQELTKDTPKALIKAGGLSLLERLIIKMKVQGITEIIINVHHHANQIINFLEDKDHFGISIRISDEKEALLETGGGIFHAAPLLGDEPFIVHNVDILSDIDLRTLYSYHLKNNALVTLAVKDRKTSRYLLFDEDMRMQGWENRTTGEKIIPRHTGSSLQAFAFSGIHVIDPKIFELYNKTGSFSIIDTYLQLCTSQRIQAFTHNTGLWIDAGKPEGLKLANMLMGGE